MTQTYQVFSHKKQNAILALGIFVLLVSAFLIAFNALVSTFDGIPIHPKYWEFKTVFGPWYHLLYFTNLSNLFLGVMIIWIGLKPTCKIVKNLFFVSVICISITFAVYWALISWVQVWNFSLNNFTSVITHGVNPLMGFIVLFWARKEVKINKPVLLISSSIVFVYFIFALVVYLVTGAQYEFKNGAIIYSFMHFYRPFFISTTKLWLIILLDLLIFVMGILIPIVFAFFWKAIYGIKLQLRKEPK